ncbi:MAG: PRD domain-containing protein, partial [Cellulosilyticaceae bacterium]
KKKATLDTLIGHNGSLRNAIKLIKAAILYPNKSLHILINTYNGCGASYVTRLMYKFALDTNVLPNNASYIKINCKNFAKNIEAIDDELFDFELNKSINVFYRAQGGMLFLENFDLLTAKQQSKLYDYLDTGKLYNDDKSLWLDCPNIFLVLSVSNYQQTNVNKKIPVSIDLPKLKDRPLEEVFDLINHFFTLETQNSNRSIRVSTETIQALLLGHYEHNIKELGLEIKAACANAYVRVVKDNHKDLYVCIDDIKGDLKRNMIRKKDMRHSLDKLIGTAQDLYYDRNQGFQGIHQQSIKIDSMFDHIEQQYHELSDCGVNEGSITSLIKDHLDHLIQEYRYQHIEGVSYNTEQLSKIVDDSIIDLVHHFLETCCKEFNRTYSSSVFYGLCLHLHALLNSRGSSRNVTDQQIIEIIQDYSKEYLFAATFIDTLKKKYDCTIPLQETVMVTMFIIEDKTETVEGNPVLLYILHGDHTASSLRDVTNALTQCNNAYSYNLSLQSQTSEAIQEIRTLVQEINQGEGIIVLYDMGSIKTMMETIAEDLHIKIRMMQIPITLMGINIARKCNIKKDIDHVFHLANVDLNHLNQQITTKEQAIVTLCYTGEGGAIQLKQYIDQYSKLGYITIPLAITDKDELQKEVTQLSQIYNIHCFVGTFDPQLLGKPFISIDRVFQTSSLDLDRLLNFEEISTDSSHYNAIYEYLSLQFKHTSIPKLKKLMPDIIDEFCNNYKLNDEQKVGLFMHISCLIENILDDSLVQTKQPDHLDTYVEDFKLIRRILRKIERSFKIIIPDHAIEIILINVKDINPWRI